MASFRQQQSTPHHFLIVAVSFQGQINPARHLARRLARTTTSRVTLAVPISYHRRMFPANYQEQQPEQVIVDEAHPLVSYAAYSDGNDDGSIPVDAANVSHVVAQLKLVGSETLTRLVRSLANDGRQVTCVLYSILTAWAADVAWDILGVPSVLYWIQPAAVLSIFYHYFHGYANIVTAHRNDQDPSFVLNLPGLPPLRISDLPSMLADSDSPFLEAFQDVIKALQQTRERSSAKPTVLQNTFQELEAEAIEALHDLNLISVGPIIEKDDKAVGSNYSKDLFEQDKSAYMEWLDSKEKGSVVYISFGSFSMFSRAQMEEMSKGLAESGRPYLWVVRKDVREKEGDEFVDQLANNGEGMVIEWCDQVRVLSHRSVGCFVTHSGWNSTMESIVGGVPMVMLPQWADQATNAKLVEVWKTGVKAEANSQGVMEGAELKRCLELVMGDGERGAEIRRKAEMWREKASAAVDDDGPSVRSLIAFVDDISVGTERSYS